MLQPYRQIIVPSALVCDAAKLPTPYAVLLACAHERKPETPMSAADSYSSVHPISAPRVSTSRSSASETRSCWLMPISALSSPSNTCYTCPRKASRDPRFVGAVSMLMPMSRIFAPSTYARIFATMGGIMTSGTGMATSSCQSRVFRLSPMTSIAKQACVERTNEAEDLTRWEILVQSNVAYSLVFFGRSHTPIAIKQTPDCPSGTSSTQAKGSSPMPPAVSTQEADTIMAKIEAESNRNLDMVTQFLQTQQNEIAAINKIVDPVERKKRFDVVNANFKMVRQETETDKKDLASLVASFLTKEQEVDAPFNELENSSSEEKAELDAAEATVTLAAADVEKAKGAWTFGGLLNPQAKAQASLDEAKTELERVKAELRRKVRDRILNANPDQSLATLQLRGERTVRSLEANKKILEVQLAISSAGRDANYSLVQASDDKVRVIETEMEQLNAKLHSNVDQLERMTESSPVYLELQAQTAALKQQIEAKKNQHTAALGIKNEAMKDALEYGGAEQALTQTIGAIDTMIHVTRVKNENMPKKRAIYTKIVQGGAIQEISKDLADVGDSAQKRMMERMVQIGQAATNPRQEFFAAQPERIRERKEIRLAQEEAMIAALKKDEQIR